MNAYSKYPHFSQTNYMHLKLIYTLDLQKQLRNPHMNNGEIIFWSLHAFSIVKSTSSVYFSTLGLV